MLSIALACFTLVTGIFGAYFFLIIRSPRKPEYLRAIDEAMSRALQGSELPKISILIPAYNEEKVIETKLRDVAAMRYPHDRREVLLIDDSSTDDTRAIAERVFRELGLPGRIIGNSERMGVNECYNRGVQESAGDLVATTDADVMVDHDVLMRSVKILGAFANVGGVTATMVPFYSSCTTTVRIERSYRDFYNTMLVAESALYSTFPGHGEFTLLRKSAFAPMPPGYGSSDGNISLAIMRKGLRLLCAPNIFFYEPIATRLGEQVRQKTRRAARMIQSGWANRDMLFRRQYGDFGAIIFPLRFLMMTICPPLFFVGSVAVVVATAYVSVYLSLSAILLALLGLFMGNRLKLDKVSLLHSLVVHECYLLLGLLQSGRRRSAWRPVQRSLITRGPQKAKVERIAVATLWHNYVGAKGAQVQFKINRRSQTAPFS
jgi:cellulose synthase/poly-beta-1,6-N-acetylglucosamine synthase-like glycosyltransferase